MKISISQEEFRKRSLFLATPIYGGQSYAEYNVSMEKLKLVLNQEGLRWADLQTLRESLVPRARNYLAHYFLGLNMSHMLFIDADVVFEPEDALRLLALASPESEYDVVCGAYPKKLIRWDKIRDAAKAGFGDEDPEILAEFIGEFFFRPVNPNLKQAFDLPIDVIETGTGFMMIQRHVFDRIANAHPELAYIDEFVPGEEYIGFFNMPIVNRRLLSEDFDFCRLVRELGMKVWVDPTINLGHMGTFKYQGNISAQVALLNKRKGE